MTDRFTAALHLRDRSVSIHGILDNPGETGPAASGGAAPRRAVIQFALPNGPCLSDGVLYKTI